MKAAAQSIELARLRSAGQGRVSVCLVGKPLEALSYREGVDGVCRYLGTVLPACGDLDTVLDAAPGLPRGPRLGSHTSVGNG